MVHTAHVLQTVCVAKEQEAELISGALLMLSCMSDGIDIPAADSRMLWFQEVLEVLNCNLNTRSLHAIVTPSKHTWLSLKKIQIFCLREEREGKKRDRHTKGYAVCRSLHWIPQPAAYSFRVSHLPTESTGLFQRDFPTLL